MAERESREVWAKRVARWSDSGLTTAQFEAETGISGGRLAYWKWRLKAEADQKIKTAAPVEETSFVEVIAAPVAKKLAAKTAPKAEPFDVIVDEEGLRIRVPLHFDAAALRRLILTLVRR